MVERGQLGLPERALKGYITIECQHPVKPMTILCSGYQCYRAKVSCKGLIAFLMAGLNIRSMTNIIKSLLTLNIIAKTVLTETAAIVK
jgi:hypothetical protein